MNFCPSNYKAPPQNVKPPAGEGREGVRQSPGRGSIDGMDPKNRKGESFAAEIVSGGERSFLPSFCTKPGSGIQSLFQSTSPVAWFPRQLFDPPPILFFQGKDLGFIGWVVHTRHPPTHLVSISSKPLTIEGSLFLLLNIGAFVVRGTNALV